HRSRPRRWASIRRMRAQLTTPAPVPGGIGRLRVTTSCRDCLDDIQWLPEVIKRKLVGHTSRFVAELLVAEELLHVVSDSALTCSPRQGGSGTEPDEARSDVVLVATLGDAEHRDALGDGAEHASVTAV